MEIRPSDLFKPTTKVIKYSGYENALVASEGPNTVAKFPLTKQFNYESVFTGKMILQPGIGDQPIVYGFVGNQITFLAISIDYNYLQSQNSSLYPKSSSYGSNNSGGLSYGGNYNNEVSNNAKYPSCNNSSNGQSGNYIEYYFEDEPLIRRPITDLLVLTGNEYHKIPQIYVYNPSTTDTVMLTIMAANIGNNVISPNINNTRTTFTNLTYTSILSDQTQYLIGYTGSTQFQIYNGSGNLILSIPYMKIEIVEVVHNTMTVSTDSDTLIDLVFLSEFNARQAHSRMSWVLEDYTKRYLTPNNPPVDDQGPVINFYSAPINHYSGVTLTKDQLRYIFIQSIVDARDGNINIYNANVVIQKQNSILQFETITEPGTYWIYFSVKDIAGNETSGTKTLYVYDSAPRIVYKTPTTPPDTMFINDSWYYKVVYNQNIISVDDIRTYYIDHVEDYVDTIPNSGVTVTISSGTTFSGITSSGITLVGNFNIKFSVSNGVGLTTTDTKNLNVYTDYTMVPYVYYNSGYTETGYTISSQYTQNRSYFLTEVVSAITYNEYDPYTTVDSIEIDGLTFPTTGGTYSTIFKLSNYSGIDNSSQPDHTKDITII